MCCQVSTNRNPSASHCHSACEASASRCGLQGSRTLKPNSGTGNRRQSSAGAQAAMATRDVDMLFDTRKRIAFFTAMKKIDSSLIGVLRKADASFEVTQDQRYTARNQDGFEVDVIRRTAVDGDPHPLRMSDDEDDFWAVQVSMGEKLQSARRMDQVVVSTSGEMALMRTVHPLDYARIKRQLSQHQQRDVQKRGKDSLQLRHARV